ncbi:hypothetical protein XELAEV_18035052mg [Xenopus laevis]|uniref:Uncharacterized protein n=1 Tax=Xenopus laevis TaxID=8355 RepID=A0A974HBR0_XENLA|nr:hypothetical protein XELAEV_18035052mg [Xenopus laevis]
MNPSSLPVDQSQITCRFTQQLLLQPHTSLCSTAPSSFPCENDTLSSQHTQKVKHSPPSSQLLHIRNFSVHTCCHTKSHQKSSPHTLTQPLPTEQYVCKLTTLTRDEKQTDRRISKSELRFRNCCMCALPASARSVYD